MVCLENYGDYYGREINKVNINFINREFLG